jgi:hypothetical protein
MEKEKKICSAFDLTDVSNSARLLPLYVNGAVEEAQDTIVFSARSEPRPPSSHSAVVG